MLKSLCTRQLRRNHSRLPVSEELSVDYVITPCIYDLEKFQSNVSYFLLALHPRTAGRLQSMTAGKLSSG